MKTLTNHTLLSLGIALKHGKELLVKYSKIWLIKNFLYKMKQDLS